MHKLKIKYIKSQLLRPRTRVIDWHACLLTNDCPTRGLLKDIIRVAYAMFRSALLSNVPEGIKGWQTRGCTTRAPPGRIRDTLITIIELKIQQFNSQTDLSIGLSKVHICDWVTQPFSKFILCAIGLLSPSQRNALKVSISKNALFINYD